MLILPSAVDFVFSGSPIPALQDQQSHRFCRCTGQEPGPWRGKFTGTPSFVTLGQSTKSAIRVFFPINLAIPPTNFAAVPNMHTIGDHDLTGPLVMPSDKFLPSDQMSTPNKGPAIRRYAGMLDLFSVLSTTTFAITGLTATMISSVIAANSTSNIPMT